MDFITWAFYAFIAAIALAAVVLNYRLREPAGRGRGLLVGLRATALALLILLLFDPVIPAATGAGAGDTILLVDASLSMRLPDTGGRTRWEQARQLAATLEADRTLRFGEAEVGAWRDADDAVPEGTATRLEPAIRAAAEAGATRVVVVTDGGVEDAAEALGLAESAGVAVEVRRVGQSPAANAGIAEVEAPAWLEVGEEAGVRVGVAALGPVPESLTVVLREGARELARARVETPPPGRLAMTTLRFTPAAGAAGAVRLDVELEGEDAAPEDDTRSVYLRIAEEPAGVAVVSFAPDQEPRFLLPVLERSLGVPVRGWLALPEGRFLRLGAAADAGLPGTEAEARRAVEEADLVVLHGFGPASPAWAREAVASAERALVFPAAAQLEGVPVRPGAARPGDWYLAGEVPASPVASLLAGVTPGDAPPLRALRLGEAPSGWWTPLNARLGRQGEPWPVLLAGSTDGRRVAVALGEGYWRWAFSGPQGREVYDRMWAAVGGWLMAERDGAGAETVRPAQRVVARGEPVAFRAGPGVDSVHVRLTGSDPEEPVFEEVLPIRDGTVVAGVLRPGHYRYQARPFPGPGGTTAGELTVESYTPELTRPAVELTPAAVEGDGGRAVRGGRPLRASAWPYVLLVLLLCTEWVLRRRWGLR